MFRKLCLALILLSAGCHSEPKENDPFENDLPNIGRKHHRGRAVPRPAPADFGPDLSSSEGVLVKLDAGKEDSPLAPRYSPPGKPLSLKPVEIPDSIGVEGLETEVALGFPLEKHSPIKLLVCRAAIGEPYSKLIIDENANGVFDETPIIATHSESRGNTWSNFSATLKAKYFIDDQLTMEDYPVAFWIAVASATEQPAVLRMSRRGFKSGEVELPSGTAVIVLSDSNNDALFGEGDWWELRDGDAKKGNGSRSIGDFHWLGETAYKMNLIDASGNGAKLQQFDPGKTREQDELDRDPYGADKRAIKAEKPLEFRQDADEAIAEAKAGGKRCFIKFETTWCGPCKSMTQHVFTAQDVVDASKDVICVKVDGDERRDLVERYSVNAYPTGVLLAADGSEAARFVGYQNVVEMAKFLTPKN